jgi:hypothetical protein
MVDHVHVGSCGDAGQQSRSMSGPARRRRPAVTVHVGSGSGMPARSPGNGEIPTPLQDLIEDVETNGLMVLPSTGSWRYHQRAHGAAINWLLCARRRTAGGASAGPLGGRVGRRVSRMLQPFLCVKCVTLKVGPSRP